MIIGLDAPTKGSVTGNGRAYAGHSAPLHEVFIELSRAA